MGWDDIGANFGVLRSDTIIRLPRSAHTRRCREALRQGASTGSRNRSPPKRPAFVRAAAAFPPIIAGEGSLVRTKFRHLAQLETSQRQAMLTALSRKGDWHLAKTLATQTGMTNQWLEHQGLASVRDLWIQAHGDA